MKRVFHPIGEGFFRCGTEVYSGTTDVVVVEWATIDKEYDEESEANIRECMDFPPPSHPRLVRIDRGLSDKPESSWRTTQGLQLGNSIRKVERLAGAPFMISICGCDTGGETDLEENPHFKKLGIRIGFPYEDAETLYERLPEGGHDAAILSSDVPNSMAHHFIVNEMIVVIDE